MIFNSLPFLIFLPVVFILYWFIFKGHTKWQNLLVLVASYIFYGWWDYRFLALVAASTLVDYILGLAIAKKKLLTWRKAFLICSILFNLGLLGFFKYFNFFIKSWIDAGESLGFTMHLETLQIILPVGISFYTFQTLSYTIDVYRNRITPTPDFIKFAAFVSFFPQLVAGPIERASRLLPQFAAARKFNFEFAKSGVHLIIWGLFQKIVIADNCATFVNAIFSNYENLNSLSLTLGAIYFAFQIYGDFAGYSNIAIGTGRLLGFDLMRNFNYPYFSRNVGEFWRRWHISLSTWFRDYLYIPLGGSRGSKFQQIRNTFIIFLVSGLWHGANWTFVAWGALHALFFIPLLIKKTNRKYPENSSHNQIFPPYRELVKMIFTFSIVCIAWVFFRSPSINDSFGYFISFFSNFSFVPEYLVIGRYNMELLLLIAIFVLIEWFYRGREEPITGNRPILKTSLALLMIVMFGVYSEHSDFIYFQF
ncbi:MBOAT family O-acyltransferase [Autumnicola edwardsiae]|uniref:MBOAT family O-acyltransferase n=1 Tax=Autumnicola edwardsiae TaxID=3075594 RepID=A0ABU3CX80_9FLAO|nr:MBOAT family O-acyltransferase [Zunongwangia sp. F297]MDT0650817.1 MBOAT family O-acyltransferase [Zunongwangia sp. F297]